MCQPIISRKLLSVLKDHGHTHKLGKVRSNIRLQFSKGGGDKVRVCGWVLGSYPCFYQNSVIISLFKDYILYSRLYISIFYALFCFLLYNYFIFFEKIREFIKKIFRYPAVILKTAFSVDISDVLKFCQWFVSFFKLYAGGKSVVQYGDQCANCKTYYNLANCDFGSRYSQFLLADIYPVSYTHLTA